MDNIKRLYLIVERHLTEDYEDLSPENMELNVIKREKIIEALHQHIRSIEREKEMRSHVI